MEQENDKEVEVKGSGGVSYRGLLFFGFLFLVVSFGLHFFSFEETVIREQGLEKTLFCVHWSEPFVVGFEEWKNRDQIWTYAWNDPESGEHLMQKCLLVDFGFRFIEDFNRSG